MKTRTFLSFFDQKFLHLDLSDLIFSKTYCYLRFLGLSDLMSYKIYQKCLMLSKYLQICSVWRVTFKHFCLIV